MTTLDRSFESLENYRHPAVIDYGLMDTFCNAPTDDEMYSLHHDSELVLAMVSDLVKTEKPYIDKVTHPDIADSEIEYSVYKVGGGHRYASVARSIEGTVMEAEWRQNPSQTAEEASVFEQNSLFFIVIDTTNPKCPKPAASLRVADCIAGPSETVQYYRAENGVDAKLPDELMISEQDTQRGLWDVVGVMAAKNYRNGSATAWAYHALYKASQEEGVHRWIANIHDNEYKNLNGLGIPFRLIPDTKKVLMHREGMKPLPVGFYNIDVDKIRISMTTVIEALESANDHKKFRTFLAKLSRIALDGKFTNDDIAA